MKQILLPLAFVGAVVVLLGITGFWFVNYVQHRPVQPPGKEPPKAAPISYEEMEKLEGKGEQAASEMNRLLACFETDDEDLRVKAAETLKEIGKKAVDPVRGKLKHKDPKVRFYAAQTLALIGPDAAAAAEDLRECLKDADADVRYKAAYALGRLGVSDEAVITSLMDLMVDADENVANQALESLEKIGPPASKVLYPVLAVKHVDPRRERILALLVKLGPPPRDAVGTLTELSKDPSQSIRGNAMRLLGQLGKDALPAFKDALKKASDSDDFDLMDAVARLGADGKDLLPEMSVYLVNRKFWDAENESMTPFKKSGADGATALADLLKTLLAKMGNPLDHREMAVLRTLGQMGADAKPAVPTLVVLMKDKESYRTAILQTLGDIGPAARFEAAAAVEALAKDARYDKSAATALARMGVIKK